MWSLQILVLQVPRLCTQISNVHSLIRCLLIQKYLWWEAAGNTYVHIYNYEYIYVSWKSEHITPYFWRTDTLVIQWHYGKSDGPHITRVLSKVHTCTGETNSKREVSERVKQCQSVLPLLLRDKCSCLEIINNIPDCGLVRCDRRISNKTAFPRHHNTMSVSSRI